MAGGQESVSCHLCFSALSAYDFGDIFTYVAKLHINCFFNHFCSSFSHRLKNSRAWGTINEFGTASGSSPFSCPIARFRAKCRPQASQLIMSGFTNKSFDDTDPLIKYSPPDLWRSDRAGGNGLYDDTITDDIVQTSLTFVNPQLQNISFVSPVSPT
jgi:hypothetical protein